MIRLGILDWLQWWNVLDWTGGPGAFVPLRIGLGQIARKDAHQVGQRAQHHHRTGYLTIRFPLGFPQSPIQHSHGECKQSTSSLLVTFLRFSRMCV